MYKILLFISIALITSGSIDRHKPAYVLYDENGKQINYRKMIRKIENADIFLFGELHDNPISHWLRYEIVRDLHKSGNGGLILGAEMFEADNQLILDEYLEGIITEQRFEEEARIWPNYRTDYRPLVRFARENSIPVVASNIPRRYANMVFHGGFEALDRLDQKALDYIAPLPIIYDPGLPGYRGMLEMNTGMPGHAGENLPKAQAIKDATMAHFILENRMPGKLFIHFHGTYHSDNFEGIYWYLRQQDPDLKIVTLSSLMLDEPGKLNEEARSRADFLLVVSGSMTRTFSR
jgi:uncharacterized iron-regulated protein